MNARPRPPRRRGGAPHDRPAEAADAAAERPRRLPATTTPAGSTERPGPPPIRHVRLALLGLGLIGGSIARALRLEPATSGWHVVAWSPSGRGPAAALADGVIEAVAATPEDALAGADLVVLAAPATDCLALLDGLAGPWRASLPEGAVVTDVASTKGAIGERAEASGLRFVGGHPMAGREATGYEAAHGGPLRRPAVDPRPGCHRRRRRGRAVVASLARACGARPVIMTAEDHDAAVAGISHLPLVASIALVEAVAGAAGEPPRTDWPEAAGLAAGAWRDMTRIARGDPGMGAAIATTNAPGDRGAAAGLSRRHRRLARRARGARRAGRGHARGAPRGRPRSLEAPVRMDELVLVVPRATSSGGGGLARRAHGPARGLRGHRGPPRPVRPARGGGGGPEPQADHPVPRAARRGALLPHAPHAGRRGRPAARPLLDRRRRAPEPRRRRPARRPAPGVARGAGRGLRARFELVGLLNDDSTDVGSVHLGAVYVADAGGRAVDVRETDKLEGGFAGRDEVAAVVDRMETWSQLVFDALPERNAVP